MRYACLLHMYIHAWWRILSSHLFMSFEMNKYEKKSFLYTIQCVDDDAMQCDHNEMECDVILCVMFFYATL